MSTKIGALQKTAKELERALATFCELCGASAKILQEKELLPEGYGQRVLDDLSRTIREARQEEGGEHVSEYVQWLERAQTHFRRCLTGSASNRRSRSSSSVGTLRVAPGMWRSGWGLDMNEHLGQTIQGVAAPLAGKLRGGRLSLYPSKLLAPRP